jgi:hypothetical protein
MDVEALLADSVAAAEGKLYVQGGGWNLITMPVVPAPQSRIGIAIVFRVPYTATNQEHRFEIHLEGEDSTDPLPLGDAPPNVPTVDGKIRKFGGTFNVGRPPDLRHGDEQLLPMALNIDGLVFERVGAYRFVISIDGTPIKALGFRVAQLSQAKPLIG